MGAIIPDPVLDWDLGPPRRWDPRHLLLVVVGVITVVAVAVIVLETRGPGPAPVPKPVAAPAIALAAPSGHEGEGGYPVGFPRTDLGAASAAAAALEAAWTLDGAQAEQAAVLYAAPDQRQAARDGARAAVRGWRETLGLPAEGDLPDGAALRTQTIGIQWTARSEDQIQVSVLVQVTASKGAGGTGPLYSSPYAMSLLMAWAPDMRGAGKGDWVNVPDPTPPSVPPAALPGTPEFAAAGWKSLTAPRPTP
ncbi:hypothetical protein [Microbispora sp. ATCC PTA-5024]|uniref:hypothetical protein n=1 Tax=Microbispora sp. ATCC PTA-5024 TaxID=316330 RepID=UPI0003DBD4EC|nr:hypothetical protein [Microbispora sp. ATCC PTA-5024]ETK35519.1 hypothetical protein MPTA5024_13905 [Microbispora sp. ATCC PTA-5024]